MRALFYTNSRAIRRLVSGNGSAGDRQLAVTPGTDTASPLCMIPGNGSTVDRYGSAFFVSDKDTSTVSVKSLSVLCSPEGCIVSNSSAGHGKPSIVLHIDTSAVHTTVPGDGSSGHRHGSVSEKDSVTGIIHPCNSFIICNGSAFHPEFLRKSSKGNRKIYGACYHDIIVYGAIFHDKARLRISVGSCGNPHGCILLFPFQRRSADITDIPTVHYKRGFSIR